MKTMNIIKKMATIGAALAMVATTMALPTAFATNVNIGTKTETDTTVDSNDYKAVKLVQFDGNNATWAAGINGDVIKNAVSGSTIETKFDNITDVKSFANACKDMTETEEKELAKCLANALEDTAIEITNGAIDDNAYYLIVGSSSVGENSAKSLGMLVDTRDKTDLTIKPKVDVAKVEKKVWEDENGEWQDVADQEQGKDVSFRLYAELPSNLDNYDSYFLKFNDTLDQPGFDSEEAFKNVKVYLNGDEITGNVELEQSETTTNNDGNLEHSFTINNVKNIEGVKAGDKIIIEYTAKLSENAIVTPTTGNDNSVTLVYPNNPNHKYDKDGDGTTDDTPDKPDTPKGETPKDEVRVLTYGIELKKISSEGGENGEEVPLAGAEFLLSNGFEYAVIDGNGNITGWTTSKDNLTPLVTDENGKLGGLDYIKGVDEGTYIFEEIKAPEGYTIDNAEVTAEVARTWDGDVNSMNFENDTSKNPLDTLTVKVSNVTSNDWESGNQVSVDSGIATIKVTNTPEGKIDLPSTGSIGTKIFTIGGSVLVAGAGITLIAKKRVKKEEE